MPKVLMIMICLRCALGGAEKRYARFFEMLVAQGGGAHKILINRSMLALLQSSAIFTGHADSILVLDPPSSRVRWLQRVRLLGLAVDALWYVWQCWRVMVSIQPQIVHPLLTAVYLSLPAQWLLPAVRRVMSAYSYQFENYRDRKLFGVSLGATLKRFAMQRSALIDALSHSIRDDLVARGLNPAKIAVTPGSFTDLALCQPVMPKQPWIVFVGRFVAIKQPLLLVEAMPTVLAQYPTARFYFLGEGPLQAQIEQRAQELAVAAALTITFEPQPPKILNQSAIFVSLQTEENYPSQSLLEAMACANAIVATDVGESWRLVDKSNGLRVPAQAEAVGQALVQLLADPALAQRQQASRERILRDHTPERFFEYMVAVYRQAMIEQNGAGGGGRGA